MKDVAYDLVANAVSVRYEGLPEDIVDVTKKFILDTIGCGIAGSTAPGCADTVELIKDWGGKPESTIMVFGGKVIATHAAMVNAMMITALDIDDVHEFASVHANVAALSAALAVSERRGKVTGKDLIAAVAAGVDVTSRVGAGIVGPQSWIVGSVSAYFGAAVAAGKILGLDTDKMHNTLGIVLSQCAGSAQCLFERALVKRLQNAYPASAGVLAAILAERGITGPKDIFESKWGFYPLYFKGSYNRERIIRGLGQVFEGKNLAIKHYVGGRYTHPTNDAALILAEKYDIKPEDVEEVTAHVPEISYMMTGRPFEIGRTPQVDAQFSIPYGIALCIARRHAFIEDFDEARIRSDVRVFDLSQKVKVIPDQGAVADVGRTKTPVIVEIKTRDGKVYSQRVDVTSGNPGVRSGWDDVEKKFRKCCTFSATPIADEKVEEIIQVISKLETLPDVGAFAEMLAPPFPIPGRK
ncbi:MAG: MmgE/PrpD family protein [Chloroflexi bacterium]|nr:MmgE/PrpD family protein [Chloroflexota bacterium]